jgi:phosphate transport system substrate-binding protein
MRTLSIALCVIVLSLGIFAGCSKSSGKKIVIKGSTTVLPITQKAAEEYRKSNKISISITGSGSGDGIKALIDGTCDIANSSRAMKDDELKQANAKGISVKEIICGYDMIVPIVHPENTISDVSLDQLKGIYNGSITSWKEVGGKKDEKIVVISRDTSSGTYEVWYDKIMKKTDVRKDAMLQASNGAIVSVIASNPRAIGYIGFGYINDSIKPLTLNKVAGTIENGKSGKYLVFRKLYMYVNEKKYSEETKGFIDFILGEQGQALVKKAGYIPL